MATPAGWYADPEGSDPRITRYWNGSRWTDHRQAPPGVFIEPTPKQRSDRRRTRKWLILAAAAVVALLVVGNLLGGGERDTSNDLTSEQWAELRAECVAHGKFGHKEVESCAVDLSLERYPYRR